MYASVAISSGLSEFEMCAILTVMSSLVDIFDVFKAVALEFVGLEAEDEASCAVVINGLIPINGEIIKSPIKNTDRRILLLILIGFYNVTNT